MGTIENINFMFFLDETITHENAPAKKELWQKTVDNVKLWDKSTSYGRFYLRKEAFVNKGTPVLVHNFWWFMHNCVSHPLIGLCPVKPAFEFHDYTSRKINKP